MKFDLGPLHQHNHAPAGGQVALCDCTLRDGEGCGVRFDLSEKIDIAERLSAAGISQIQIGSLRREADHILARELCAMGLSADIEVMTRATAPTFRTEIEQTVRYGADVTHSLVPLSPYSRGAYGDNLDDGTLLGRIAEVVTHAKNSGAQRVNITLLDATRCIPALLKAGVLAAAEAGADIINLPDTVGICTPPLSAELIRTARGWLDTAGAPDVKLRVHFHDDFGLATANALAAAAAGADMVDTCVNGLGKRAGNVDMAQFAIGAETLYGLATGVRIDRLYELCHGVSQLSGVPVAGNAPFVGDLVFADDSEAHIRGGEAHRFAFQAIDPEDFGGGRRLLITGSGGKGAVRTKIDRLGLPPLDDDGVEDLLSRCLDWAARKPRGRRYVDTGEFMELYEHYTGRTLMREGEQDCET